MAYKNEKHRLRQYFSDLLPIVLNVQALEIKNIKQQIFEIQESKLDRYELPKMVPHHRQLKNDDCKGSEPNTHEGIRKLYIDSKDGSKFIFSTFDKTSDLIIT